MKRAVAARDHRCRSILAMAALSKNSDMLRAALAALEEHLTTDEVLGFWGRWMIVKLVLFFLWFWCLCAHSGNGCSRFKFRRPHTFRFSYLPCLDTMCSQVNEVMMASSYHDCNAMIWAVASGCKYVFEATAEALQNRLSSNEV